MYPEYTKNKNSVKDEGLIWICNKGNKQTCGQVVKFYAVIAFPLYSESLSDSRGILARLLAPRDYCSLGSSRKSSDLARASPQRDYLTTADH